VILAGGPGCIPGYGTIRGVNGHRGWAGTGFIACSVVGIELRISGFTIIQNFATASAERDNHTIRKAVAIRVVGTRIVKPSHASARAIDRRHEKFGSVVATEERVDDDLGLYIEPRVGGSVHVQHAAVAIGFVVA